MTDIPARRYRLLSKKEEVTLANRWKKKKDRKAFDRLVESQMALVIKIANDFSKYPVAIEDLVQEGNVGLVVAVDKFNPRKGARLSTYASYWIKAYMINYAVRNYGPVKIGSTRQQRKLFFHIGKARQAIFANGHMDTAEEIAKTLDVPEEAAALMMVRVGQKDVCLDAPLRWLDRGEGGYSIPSTDPSPEESVADFEEKDVKIKNLRDSLGNLSGVERFIIEKRGLSEDPWTLQKLGDAKGFSRERARQIEERAKQKIKASLCREFRA